MTAVVVFDTYELIKTLKGSGLPEAQAEAISTAMRQSHEAADLATKQDVVALENRVDNKFDRVDSNFELLRKDIRTLEERVNSKFKELELSMTIKLGGIVVVALGAFTAFSKLL